MSTLMATAFASQALALPPAPTPSTGTAQGPWVSTATTTTALSSSTVAVPAISTAAVSVSSITASTEAAVPPSYPRPWVLGEIAVSGNKNVKSNVIRSQAKARKGGLYDRPDLDRDIQNLLGLGNFERVGADISSTGKPVPDHFRKVSGSSTTMKLTFFVEEKPLVKKIKFAGNKKLSKGVLSDTVNLKPNDPLDSLKLREDEDKLLEKYHDKGFLDASVKSAVQVDTGTLKAEVTFTVNESTKSAIFWVTIRGVKTFKLERWWPKEGVRQLMKNRRKKVFFEKDLKEDQKKIETFYLNHGFLDVVVSTPTVLFSLDRTRIYIDIDVVEGRAYKFGDTTFSGNLIYTSTELAKTVEYRRGRVFNQEKYEETIRGVQELYAEKGRLSARVSPVKTHNEKTDLMDVHYGIVEGDPFYIDHVDVEGNKATKTYVLKREVVVKPGQLYQESRIRKSRERIMNLGFIDDVDVDRQRSPTEPDKVDVTFDVAEGKPGILTAGAAYSSIDGLIGTLSLQHLNLFGRAQRASVQWSFGRRVQDYSASWTTPWVYDHPVSLGFDIFNTRRINPFQDSISAYVEKNRGGTIRVGPRFEEDKYHLNLSYTYSEITVTNVQDQFKGALSEGTSIYSSASAEFARDTRNNIWDPTSGSRHAVGLGISGGPFGGDIHFLKPSINNSVHFRLFSIEDYPFVLTFANRAAYITQFDGTKEVPVFSRFYLGGQDTLRGYSPTGEVGFPSGGKVFDVFNVEFGFPLARERRHTIVKLVAFFDAGTTWDRVKDISGRIGSGERDIKTDAGIGLRFTTPAFPIRLDWGYGFNHRSGERLYQINFGLGNLF